MLDEMLRPGTFAASKEERVFPDIESAESSSREEGEFSEKRWFSDRWEESFHLGTKGRREGSS